MLQDDPSPERMRRLLDERRAAVARRIDAEQAQLAAIEARIRHLEGDRDAAPGAVVRDVPAAFVASLRRVVPDYGVVDSLFDEIARALPDTARIAGHGAVWHHCAPHKRQIDCEALVLLERRCLSRFIRLYRLPACRAACVVHPSDEGYLRLGARAPPPRPPSPTNRSKSKARCASATSRAPATAASTSPRSSSRCVHHEEPSP